MKCQPYKRDINLKKEKERQNTVPFLFIIRPGVYFSEALSTRKVVASELSVVERNWTRTV